VTQIIKNQSGETIGTKVHGRISAPVGAKHLDKVAIRLKYGMAKAMGARSGR
jgi:hypothetical protein